ncbi:ubiquitin-like protein ATG12 [Ornithodoros turicata]|uniref:ubiquitin-like protein ATG12 n=1 Tax=Ornithodoros turicata TaxID=34597 RepID=UPI00313924EB
MNVNNMADVNPKLQEDDDKSEENQQSSEADGTDNKEVSQTARSDQLDSVSEPVEKKKIDVLLKPTGNAPIMQKRKWAVSPQMKIKEIIEFIRKYLKMEQTESLFLYVNQAFAPPLDHDVKNLYECFGTNGKLILHYATTPAWG